MQRRHDDSAVELLVAAVAKDEAQEARAARRDTRQAHQLLLQRKNGTVQASPLTVKPGRVTPRLQ